MDAYFPTPCGQRPRGTHKNRKLVYPATFLELKITESALVTMSFDVLEQFKMTSRPMSDMFSNGLSVSSKAFSLARGCCFASVMLNLFTASMSHRESIPDAYRQKLSLYISCACFLFLVSFCSDSFKTLERFTDNYCHEASGRGKPC